MNNQYQVTATIVLYKNNIEELKRAIWSFLNTNLKVRIYLVDNSPIDELKSLASLDERVEYLFMNCNNGFGAGHNKIMRQLDKMGEFHLVLNPDIYFEAGVIEALYEYMQANPDVGNVLPKVIYPNGDLQYLCSFCLLLWTGLVECLFLLRVSRSVLMIILRCALAVMIRK